MEQDEEDKTKVTITALDVGEVTITATLGELTDTCSVTCNAVEIPITSATFDNKADINLAYNQTVTRTVTITPANYTTPEVEYYSQDPTAVQVTKVSDTEVSIKGLTGAFEDVIIGVGHTVNGSFAFWDRITVHTYSE